MAQDAYGAVKNLVIMEHQCDDYRKIFSKRSLFDGSEKTWSQMHETVNSSFNQNQRKLAKEWGLRGKVLKAAFVMNVVHNMWGLGANSEAEDAKDLSDVFSFKKARSGLDEVKGLSPGDYLTSPVASCNDYSMIAYLLLSMDGLKAMQVGTGEHIYVECWIDGKPYIVDAMNNFMAQMGNKEFLAQPLDEEKIFHLFPYSNSNPGLPEYYRKDKGALRHYWILFTGRLERDKESFIFPHWNRFHEYIKSNQVLMPPDGAEPLPMP